MNSLKQNNTWLITFLDLLMILTCFFILIYSICIVEFMDKSNKNHESVSTVKSITFHSHGSLRVIFDSLAKHLRNNKSIKIYDQGSLIRIIPAIDINNMDSVASQAKEVGVHLFNFTRNLIKVSLIINPDYLANGEFSEEVVSTPFPNRTKMKIDTKDTITRNKITNLIEITSQFRDILSKYSGNNFIVTVIELDHNIVNLTDNGWLITTNIYAESKI
ncbi:MAG: flagellar motor protein MotB [Rickettsiaceae bacterium]|nr:flagellar motor protein MotB [Rickettsiaceae bacterium]